FERVQQTLSRRRRAGPSKVFGAERYPLSGTATCSSCSAPVLGTARVVEGRWRYRHMRCSTTSRRGKEACSQKMVRAEVLEGHLAAYLSDMRLPPEYLGAVVEELRQRRSIKVDPSDRQRLEMMADWLTAAENDQFARAQVNRIWYHLMGAGIVTPIDDFRATNPPINGPLLDALADDFVKHKFNVRHLIGTIMNSRTYQLSAEPNATNRDDAVNFSRALVRRLSAEQLHDAIHLAAGVKSRFNGYDEGTRAVQLPGVRSYRRRDKRPTTGEMFLKTFGKPGRLLSCECERSDDTTLKQAFVLISGQMVNDVLQRDGGRVDVLAKSKKSNREIVDELTWATLSRSPSDVEITGLVAHLNKAKDRKSGIEDVAWALINAKEFLLRK
ncbi:MAG: DUF1553 domain-containing protein, partial [Planctomycetes bacterium]|nr:DUF1553 domain-containing protein [Planctomycetota bacterium]